MKTSWVRSLNKKGMFVCAFRCQRRRQGQGQDARLDTAYAELDERTEHFAARDLIGGAAHGDLDEQAVVMWLEQTS